MADMRIDPEADLPAGRHTHDHGMPHEHLFQEYTIETPENVSFGYEVAGIGSRFIAALVDTTILGVLLLGLNVALLVLVSALGGDMESVELSVEDEPAAWVIGFVIALYALLNFAIWWGYYLFSEWLWHGQTVGKRVAHIRVVRLDGAPVSFLPVAVRNLVRIVDFLPMAYGVGLVTMFCNRQTRRLGDFAAGTLVVKDQGELALDMLMASPPAPSPATTLHRPEPGPSPDLTPDQDWSGIRRLTAADYELVQETLARYRVGQLDAALLARVAAAIATKLERAPSSQLGSTARTAAADHVAFLTGVAAAYGRWVR
jgi:uncharacterized RDD family membrane protein YckC